MNRNKFKKNRKSEETNSDEPIEISSKKRPNPMVIFHPKNKNLRDPRFEQSSGEFNKFIFKDHFGPLLKEAQENELQTLIQLKKKEKDPERIEQIKLLIQRMKNKMNTVKTKEKEQEIIKKLKSEKRKEIKKPGPVYVTKSAITKAQLVDKFKKLKQSGKLNKYIEKKRKKNIDRDRKKLNRK